MAFTYQVFVAPWLYEQLYQEMTRRGHKSVKQTMKGILIETAQDPDKVARAISLARTREGVKNGSNPVQRTE